MQATRFRAVMAASGGVAVLGMASMAWACTANGSFVGVKPLAGVQGSEVRLEGEGLPDSQAPVEIRWNTVNGPLMGTAPVIEGRFAAVVHAPLAAPGVYTILAAAEGRALARTAFEVMPASGAPTSGTATVREDMWSTDQRTGALRHNGGPDGALLGGVVLLAVGLAGATAVSTIAALRRRPTAASTPQRY